MLLGHDVGRRPDTIRRTVLEEDVRGIGFQVRLDLLHRDPSS